MFKVSFNALTKKDKLEHGSMDVRDSEYKKNRYRKSSG